MPLGVGRAASWIGKKAGAGTRYAQRHPKQLIGGAAALGFMSNSPFKKTGIGPAFMEATTGDPQAFQKVINAKIQNAVHNMFTTPGEQAGFEFLDNNYYRSPSTSLSSPYTGPSGSTVFGMYNLRTR